MATAGAEWVRSRAGPRRLWLQVQGWNSSLNSANAALGTRSMFSVSPHRPCPQAPVVRLGASPPRGETDAKRHELATDLRALAARSLQSPGTAKNRRTLGERMRYIGGPANLCPLSASSRRAHESHERDISRSALLDYWGPNVYARVLR